MRSRQLALFTGRSDGAYLCSVPLQQAASLVDSLGLLRALPGHLATSVTAARGGSKRMCVMYAVDAREIYRLACVGQMICTEKRMRFECIDVRSSLVSRRAARSSTDGLAGRRYRRKGWTKRNHCTAVLRKSNGDLMAVPTRDRRWRYEGGGGGGGGGRPSC